MFLEKNENRIIGLLFNIDGEQFTIEEINKKYSKYLSKAYQKTNTVVKRELIVKNHNTAYAPHEIIEIKLDLSKSSQITNDALLEYLQFAGQINGLVEKSILNIETIFSILGNNLYNNLITKNYILIYQQVFDSQSFLDSLTYMEKLKLYTENRYRTKEIMNKYKENFNECIYLMFKEYLLENKIDISESPSVLRNLIMSTVNDYYDSEIGFTKEKEKAFNDIKYLEDNIVNELKVIENIKEAVLKYKISTTDWKELKESSLNIVNKLFLESGTQQSKINQKKNIIRYFPK